MPDRLQFLKQIFGSIRPMRKTKPSYRPILETLEDRRTPSATPFGPVNGYDGTWDPVSGALLVNVAQADGSLTGNTLAVATVVQDGNTFVTLNGDQTAIKAAQVQSLVLSDADISGATFDLSAVHGSDFFAFTSAVAVAGLGDTTLKMNDTSRLWTVNAVDGGSASGADYGIAFTGISTIDAGMGADTFQFNDGDYLTGAIDGGTGASNTLDFSSYTTAVMANVNGGNAGSITTTANTFNFSNIQNLIGGAGTNTYDFADGGSLNTLDGGSSGGNTLDFSDTAHSAIAADITGTNAGTVSAAVAFTNIQALNGSGAGGDTYTIENGASIGAIQGGTAGNNTLRYPTGTTSNVTVNLQVQTATGVGSFSGISNATVAATGAAYALTGDDSANNWEISAPHAGVLNGGTFTFSGFNVLNAGSGGDAFTVDPAITFAGTINGNTGIDTVNLGSTKQTVTLGTGGDSANGFTGAVGTVSGGFTNIDVLNGTGNSNKLNGEDSASNWNLDDSYVNQYVTNGNTLTFSNFQTLQGGNDGDTFTCYDDFIGTLNGGTGANTFAFVGSAVLTGNIVGNSGNDTLDYFNYDLSIAVTLSADSPKGFSGAENAGSISGTFSNIDTLMGSGSDDDSLTGEDVTANWTLATPLYTYSHGTDTLTFSGINMVNGGAGADSFNIGSTLAANNGNLDNIVRPLQIDGGGAPDDQRDTIYLNDHGNIGKADYLITPTSVDSDPATTSRAFAGITYTDIGFLRLDGTDDVNVFNVQPSFDTEFCVNGNLPKPGVPQIDGSNVLNVDTSGTTGAKIQITSLGAGFWDFTSGEMRVDFINISGFNHVGVVATGSSAGPGSLPMARVFNAETGALMFQVLAYENYFRGGVRFAIADVNGDGFPDLIVAPGAKHSPLIKIYSGSPDANGNYPAPLLSSFYAFSRTFLGGVYVAAGDVNKDGVPDLVVSAGAGWLPQVKVFNGQTLLTTPTLIGIPFNAFANTYRGGVVVTVADVNNDGYADIIATPVSTSINQENVLDGNGFALLRSGRRRKF